MVRLCVFQSALDRGLVKLGVMFEDELQERPRLVFDLDRNDVRYSWLVPETKRRLITGRAFNHRARYSDARAILFLLRHHPVKLAIVDDVSSCFAAVIDNRLAHAIKESSG